ncbi:nudix-type domain-containing protein 1 isoform p22 [Ephemerocybe angulata]|uniref:Oxidized purine nucleoside triphosphate hydrolase n=1 Tax=Ephemerocybe angulata TaxID=980116 RepID=A0A8H6HEN3_9AGAR|nr:nudix-type domain-containing protein 1 isoform p22 [Tulosesus angulatus]
MTEVPPGISGNLKHYISGGEEGSQWREFSTKRHYTNAFVVQDNKILLGMKKRGWGQGKYNGFGGKVDPGETPLEAAKRELEEESGIQAPLVHAGHLLFLTEAVEWAFHIDIYKAESYTGTITESDEMKPEWFSTTSDPSAELPMIPFDRMWETDHVWLPLLIANKPFVGRADFVGEKDKSKPFKWWYGVVEEGKEL